MRKILARPGLIILSCLSLCATGLLAVLGGCGGGSSSNSNQPSTKKIQHVVVVFQENRTPDNLFQDPVLISRGADIQNFGIDSKGNKITLTPTTLQTDYDLGHGHANFLAVYNNGKMNAADLNSVGCNAGAPPTCPPPNPWFQYIDPSQAAPYFQIAETYAFGDRMFQTNQGPSFPAHQFIISATSAPSVGSNLYVSENPLNGPDAFHFSGCIAPSVETVQLITPTGDDSQTIYPCLDHPTLTDILNTAKISWRYYAPSAGIIWNAPTAIKHMCVPNAPPPNATSCTGPDWTQNTILNSAQVLTDIANNQLASVSWVIPAGQESDHPGGNEGLGPSWVASVVNAIGNSPYWANTAIIIAWDDWGGWFDHVPPPAIINSYEYGLRVPLIVASPYAKAGYISHQVNDFGSILKFIEETFGLTTVAPGASPAYADATNTTADLSDFFDFNQTPLTFQTIPAPQDGKYFIKRFIEDKTPQTAPDND